MKEFFELGRILKPQGIRGEVKAELYTDDLGRVHDLDTVYFHKDGRYEPAAVAAARTDGKFAFLSLAGVNDRDGAEKLRGSTFYIDRQHAAPLPEGAFYISDLIGLPVFCGSEEIGVLGDILQTGSKDIYVTALHDGGHLMFPAVPDVFAARDPDRGQIVLDPKRLGEVGVYDV